MRRHPQTVGVTYEQRWNVVSDQKPFAARFVCVAWTFHNSGSLACYGYVSRAFWGASPCSHGTLLGLQGTGSLARIGRTKSDAIGEVKEANPTPGRIFEYRVALCCLEASQRSLQWTKRVLACSFASIFSRLLFSVQLHIEPNGYRALSQFGILSRHGIVCRFHPLLH